MAFTSGMSPAVRLEASRLGERLMASQQAEMTGKCWIFCCPGEAIQIHGMVYLPTFTINLKKMQVNGIHDPCMI